MGVLSQRAKEKVAGPAWEDLREAFYTICEALLSVSSDTRGDLTTIYIKFTVNDAPGSQVYAVMWLKSSKRIVVGLALPEEFESDELGSAPAGMTYKGLTKYFIIERGGSVPSCIYDWGQRAFDHVASD